MRAASALLLAASLLALLTAPPARCTTVVRQTLESLTDQSDVVVRGTVERVELHAAQGARPFRLAHVRVSETIAGRAPAVVPVRLPGGVDARGLQVAVAGTPVLREGDDVMLFLSRVPAAATARATHAPPAPGRDGEVPAQASQPAGQWQPVALSLGTWRVVPQAGESPMVVPDAQARGLHQVGESAGTALPERARFSEMAHRVRARKAAR